MSGPVLSTKRGRARRTRRVYTGTRALPKTHIARMRIAGPATEETWVGDADGDPVMVLTADPSQSLAAELHRLLPDLRAVIGPDRRCTVVFDRGGYSPAVFTEIITAGFDILTYFKGAWARSAPTQFAPVDFTAPDGITHTYDLAERPIDLPVPARPTTPRVFAYLAVVTVDDQTSFGRKFLMRLSAAVQR